MGSQRSIFLTKNDQSLIGTLWIAKGPVFLTKIDLLNWHSMCSQRSIFLKKNDQSLMGILCAAKGQIISKKTLISL